MKRIKKPLMYGSIGTVVLLAIYFIILIVANSFTHALEQFTEMWYWILILVIGFGLQVGLYTHIRISMHEKVTGATTEIATAGGISTGSMVACCVHHITDVLPIIGLSVAAVFLLKYQIPFIILGIFSNLVGITMMLTIIQKHKLFDKQNQFNWLFKYDIKSIRNFTVILSLIIVSLVFANTAFSTEKVPGSEGHQLSKQSNFPAKTNDENGVSIEVKPVEFSFSKEITFDVTINTHQGSLDFDLTKISILEDDKKSQYLPIRWDGSPSGGHHRSGILTFPKIKEKTSYIKLIIKGVYDIPERVFIWNLNEISEI